jgi:hypothetical protein
LKETASARRTAVPAVKAFVAALLFIVLISFVNAQYARAVGTHKLMAPYSRDVGHPVRELMSARFYKGDMINSYQPSQFAISVLCPKELALLIRQIARGIHLCGLIAGSFRMLHGAASIRISVRSAAESILLGATVFGCGLLAPDYIRSLAIWSLGYAPF